VRDGPARPPHVDDGARAPQLVGVMRGSKLEARDVAEVSVSLRRIEGVRPTVGGGPNVTIHVVGNVPGHLRGFPAEAPHPVTVAAAAAIS
jgi:hypothetical protein